MTFEQKHKDKIIIYIIVAILVTIFVVGYVYVELVSLSTQENIQTVPATNITTPVSGPVQLSPTQTAVKSATVGKFISQKPIVLTKAQAAAKAAALKNFFAQNGGNPSVVK